MTFRSFLLWYSFFARIYEQLADHKRFLRKLRIEKKLVLNQIEATVEGKVGGGNKKFFKSDKLFVKFQTESIETSQLEEIGGIKREKIKSGLP